MSGGFQGAGGRKWANWSSKTGKSVNETDSMKLRGNSPAKVDEKGRLKIPAVFLEELKEYGTAFYITSTRGESARIYPLKVWGGIEDKLAAKENSKEKRKFLMATSYYGQMAELDGQGRVLLPGLLREKAVLKGDVAVLGVSDYLEVMNDARAVDRMEKDPLTDDEEDALGF
jgi:MraZ protein